MSKIKENGITNPSEVVIDPDKVFAEMPLWVIADNTLTFAKPGYVEENGKDIKKTKPTSFVYGDTEVTAAIEARGAKPNKPEAYYLIGTSLNPDNSIEPFRYEITTVGVLVDGKKLRTDVLSDGTNRQIDEVERQRVRAIMVRTNLQLTSREQIPAQVPQGN